MIHETAIIEDGVVLGRDVSVGAFSIVRKGVELGDNSVVENHCDIGVPSGLAKSDKLVFGADTHIRSHSVFYIGSRFGAKLVTGHRVTVRENITAGNGFQIGTLSDLQGDTEIGEYVRFHSNVHIGKTSKIGDCSWVFPYVVFTNDPHPPSTILNGPTVGKRAIVATGAILLPGVTVGDDAMIGAGSIVRLDVPDRQICVGNPCKLIGDVSRIKHSETGEPAYPWYRHFRRGYPEGLLPAEDEI